MVAQALTVTTCTLANEIATLAVVRDPRILMSHCWETVTLWFWLQDLNTHSHESVGHKTPIGSFSRYILPLLYFSFRTSASFSFCFHTLVSTLQRFPLAHFWQCYNAQVISTHFTANLDNSSWLVCTIVSRMKRHYPSPTLTNCRCVF